VTTATFPVSFPITFLLLKPVELFDVHRNG
jgi:hypothetical protein